MRSNNRFVLWALLAAALTGCAGPARLSRDLLSPDPRLSCSVERGIGGTGISSGERGLGGTGLMAANSERGIGGTGVSAGIIGTVTGFGSICVNGLRVAYDESTTVSADSLPDKLESLARGMTVAALVSQDGGTLKATRIDVLHALVGPVTSTAPLAVMGAAVATEYAAGEAPGSFSVGEMIVVDGLQRADGTIEATRLARAEKGAAASVRGSVSLTRGLFRVGGVALAPSPGALRPGNWVVASGTWTGDRLAANSLSAAPELSLPTAARVSLEGYLLPQPGGGFAVRGVAVRENLEHQLPRDVIARLASGQRVQVIGIGEADGGVRAQTIVVPDFTSPLRTEALPGLNESAADAATAPAPETVPDFAARRRAAAAAAADAASTAQTREALQLQRGTYGTTVARPEALRAITPAVPEAVRTRPIQTRPTPPIRPDAPARPDAPTRPSMPTRPDSVPQRPRG